MHFEAGLAYHVYNQGNNRQAIFFNRRNYLYFLEKIRTYIVPYADMLAYCLMPNHFHLMIWVNHTHLPASATATVGVTAQQPLAHDSHPDSFPRSLNDSIAIMLRSYTRAINIEQNRSGSLFREETKAICLTRVNGVCPAWYNTMQGSAINVVNPDKQYPNICYNYIHNNPVKDGFVSKPDDWEFSSYPDVTGLRNDKMINRRKINELGLILLSR